MSHNEKRSHWFKEWALTTMAGVVYGITSVAVGHPLDTVKTKMQAQEGFEGKMLNEIKHIYKVDGLKGFYRGVVPPLLGSAIFRSIQFSWYEGFYSYCNSDEHPLKQAIPFTGGVQYRVIFGGIFAGLGRAIIECPVEYAKVRRQTNQNWLLKDVYTGLSAQLPRTVGLLTFYYIIVDTLRRNTTLYNTKVGQFFCGGLSATFSFCLVWPFETIKNHIQAGREKGGFFLNFKIAQKLGYQGLYRGMLPGALSVFSRSGVAFMAMSWFHIKMTQWGLRD